MCRQHAALVAELFRFGAVLFQALTLAAPSRIV
ncbi:hypothetical protein MPL3365_60009 [Mesorhizobium plurifarium]|uniref:Uncharacterized protein n=1 Tax=Mesorhizobium plurifarium TaxID=69974 RepID=A0A090GAS3_MESPL|nr:hypothetical protein MPL3365_60009 [Mesorhizobium plurifarium]